MRTNLRDSVKSEMVAPGEKAKIVARNTFRFIAPNGDTVVRLHNTDVVRKTAKGKVILDSGGWKTVTTKDRMNSYSGFHVWTMKGIWYVGQRGSEKRVPYHDGIVLPDALDAPSKKGEKIEAAEKKLRAQIRKFVCTMPDEMPTPSNGDCWFCMMRTDNGQALGDATGDKEHLLSHVREGYLHGSLIFNALKWAGVAEPEYYWHLKLQDRAKAVLRRYLYRQLGLVA